MDKTLFPLMLLLLFGGCAQTQKELAPSVRHMIKSEKLKITMKKIDNVIYERHMSELDRDRIRGRYVLSLAENLRNLSEELILIEASDTKANETDAYRTYARLIDAEADALESLASKKRFEYLPARVEKVKNICNSCHTHFRVEHR